MMTIKRDICSVYMCIELEKILSPSRFSYEDTVNFRKYTVHKVCIPVVSRPVWTGVHKNEFALDSNKYVMTFSRPFFDKYSFHTFGSLIINIPGKVLKDICKDAEDYANYSVFIVDYKGNTIFNGPGENGSEPLERGYLNDILNGKLRENTFGFKIAGSNYLVKYLYSKDKKWVYIAEVPIDYLFENSAQVKSYVFLALLLSLVMSAIAAYLASGHFTVPFKKMIISMKMVENGNLDVKTGIRNKSEIGMLSGSFDNMIKEIKSLVKKVELEHELKRKEELNTLQAQITPHFLYNSLYAIKCLACIKKDSEIEEMTDSLIELLQLSISKNTVYIHIGEEIDIVKKYMLLQNFRYGNKISVKYEYDDDVLKYFVLKMVLQPLVENSIFQRIGIYMFWVALKILVQLELRHYTRN